MIAADASLAVAGLLSWHEAFPLARRALRGAAIPAHALTEAYSVLTRLPRPLGADDAWHALRLAFPPQSVLVASPDLQHTLVERCSGLGITGGAVYDALIGLTVAESDAVLVTRDRRAMATYERVGVAVRWVA